MIRVLRRGIDNSRGKYHRDDGCNVLIAGHDIRVFDLESDRFAEQNGFRHAIVGGDSGLRTVWLQR